jgi:hypothetical protein
MYRYVEHCLKIKQSPVTCHFDAANGGGEIPGSMSLRFLAYQSCHFESYECHRLEMTSPPINDLYHFLPINFYFVH